MIIMKDLILYIWQLPQHFLGLVLLAYFRAKKHSFDGIGYWYSDGMTGGISLGKYIIVNTHYEPTIRHEYGHSRQSEILGWLYLIVIGIPSLLWAMFHGKKDYSWFYTESWADRLGNVKR